LRSVDGGGEVDLDKRAITGEDDIVELDQLHSQHTEPPAARHHCYHTPAEPAKPPGPTTGAAPTTSTGEAKPPRRIVVLSDETGNADPHSDRSITAAPDHPTLPPAGPLPGTLPARPVPASEATSSSPAHASRSRRDRSRLLPSPRTTLGKRPRLATGTAILMLALTAATAIALAPGRRDHPAHNPRTTASAGTTNSAPISTTIPRAAIHAARQPARAKRTTNRRQSHVRRHHRTVVAASAPATVTATQESGVTSHSQASSYTPTTAANSQPPPSERPPTSSGTPAPTHQQSSGTSSSSTQPSKAALKSLVTGAGTCGCQ
jgi:hypothetical protein